MSYDPTAGSSKLGYVRATPVTVTNFNQTVFDNPVPSGPTVSAGDTILSGNSLCIMRVNRRDDTSGEMRSWITMGSSQPVRAGCVDVITTKLFHGVHESYDYLSTVSPTQIAVDNAANIIIDDWSHFVYWRA